MELEVCWRDGEEVAAITSYVQNVVWDYCGEVGA
jgi:hypothetical protein